MKKILSRLISLGLCISLLFGICSVASAQTDLNYALSESAISEAEDFPSEYFYIVKATPSTSLAASQAYQETDLYVEHYEINFYPLESTNGDYPSALTPDVQTVGTINLLEKEYIEIPAASFALSGEAIKVPVLSEEQREEINLLQQQGITSKLETVAVNVFYSNPKNNLSEASFVTKSDLASTESSIVPFSSDYKSSSKMYSTISIVQQTNGNQKRHSINVYYMKYKSYNDYNGGQFFINTSKKDDRPDVVALAWTCGGGVTASSSDNYLSAAYNMDCYWCGKNSATTLTKNSSSVSTHSSLFNGNSIGYNIPDICVVRCASCGNRLSNVQCFPAGINIATKTGWFTKGSYPDSNGYIKSTYVHTYAYSNLSITPNISIYPPSISFGLSLPINSNYEELWIDASVSTT